MFLHNTVGMHVIDNVAANLLGKPKSRFEDDTFEQLVDC